MFSLKELFNNISLLASKLSGIVMELIKGKGYIRIRKKKAFSRIRRSIGS